MWLRILALILIAAALIGLLVYSQLRTPPDKVSGFVEAYEIRVGSRVGGRIAKVDVLEGQHVKTGDTLVELDPFDLTQRLAEAQGKLAQSKAQLIAAQANLDLTRASTDATLTQAKAGVAAAQAGVEQAQAAITRQESAITAAEAQVASAQADVAAAQSSATLRQSDLQRFEAVDPRTIAQQQRDAAHAAADNADAQLAAARKHQTAAEAGVGEQRARLTEARSAITEAQAKVAQADGILQAAQTAPQQIAAAEAQVKNTQAAAEAQQAAVDTINKQLAELRITAPMDGLIEAVDIRPGDLLTPNGPALSIMDLSELWVRAYIPENRLNLTTGQNVRITVDSFPGRDFTGTITFIARQAEFTPGNVQTPEERSKQVFRIRVTLNNDAQTTLRPGMSADVWLTNK